MAGERTKDVRKLSVTITADNGRRRTLTNIYDYNIVGPEKVEKRNADTGGNTFLRRLADKSGDAKIIIKSGTQDEKFLDMLSDETVAFDMIIIDESAKLNSKQYSCTECYIKQLPEDSVREIDNRTYEIIISELKLVQL